MQKYEIVALSEANPIEWEFLGYVDNLARVFASDLQIANGMVRGNVHALGNAVRKQFVKDLFDGDGLRPAWLNTMAELSRLTADNNCHVASQYSTIVREIENFIYGFALAIVESK